MAEQVFFTRAGRPAPGYPMLHCKPSIIDFLKEDGRGQFGRKTLEETRAEYPDVELIGLEQAIEIVREAFRTPVREITRDQYWYALEVLPPVSWEGMGCSTQSFKISERITEDITHIYCQIGERYFEFADSIRMPHREITARCLAFMKGP